MTSEVGPVPTHSVPPGARVTANARLRRFFALTYVVTLVLCLPFVTALGRPDVRTSVFVGLVWMTYPLFYLGPAFLLVWLASGALALGGRLRKREGLAAPLLGVLAVLLTAITLALLCTDAAIYSVFGFHINGFVVNLATTRGGIESMGAGPSTYWTCAAVGAGLLGLQSVLWWVAALRRTDGSRPPALLRVRTLVLVLVAFSLTERITYGVAHVQAHRPILAAADAFPLYSRMTFDGWAESLGYEVQRRTSVRADTESLHLQYPREPLRLEPPEKPLNVVWMVAESFRADALDPEIMPQTWEFAARAQRFTRHYSGGNGTRMGVFSMFYGIDGTYWFPCLDSRRGPVLLDALIQQDYQFSINTSARFTYPEFDSTVFVDLPADSLHEWKDGGDSWQRDREHVDSILSFLDRRDRSRPFMTFSFFESPHARYMFPDECVIRQPYLEDLNFASLNLERDIELIRNRYLNSCRHLDGQVARLLDYLEREDLLDTTLVVITGDHGEEFLESGHWGHGSSFVDEQIRVPLVLWIPGMGAGEVDRMTSHLDLAATLLPRLGALNPPEELSRGFDLFGPEVRDYTLVADWSRLCIVTDDTKASFPFKAKGVFRSENSEADEGLPVGYLSRVLADLSWFRRR